MPLKPRKALLVNLFRRSGINQGSCFIESVRRCPPTFLHKSSDHGLTDDQRRKRWPTCALTTQTLNLLASYGYNLFMDSSAESRFEALHQTLIVAISVAIQPGVILYPSVAVGSESDETYTSFVCRIMIARVLLPPRCLHLRSDQNLLLKKKLFMLAKQNSLFLSLTQKFPGFHLRLLETGSPSLFAAGIPLFV